MRPKFVLHGASERQYVSRIKCNISAYGGLFRWVFLPAILLFISELINPPYLELRNYTRSDDRKSSSLLLAEIRSISDSVRAGRTNGALLLSYHHHLPSPLAFLCVSCALVLLLSALGIHCGSSTFFHCFWVFLLDFRQLCFGIVGLRIERLGPSFCLKWADNRRRLMLRSIFGSRDIALAAAFDYRAAAAPRLPIAL
jgi:hypothetical protein